MISGSVEGQVASSLPSGQTEEPEWLIPKHQQQQELQGDDVSTDNDIAESLFSTGKTSNTTTSKAPLIVSVTENPNTFDSGDTLDVAQGNTLSELMLPLQITPSSSNRRPLIEEIDDSVSDNRANMLVDSSSTKEELSANFFMTESNVNKASSFHSTTNKEPESTPTEFGGQWAERTRPLIEEMGSDDVTKTDMIKVEPIEDLEDVKNPPLYSAVDQPADENHKKENLPDIKAGSEGETDRITELAEKAGSSLDPVTVDQTLLQSLRQKYQ